MTAAVLVKGRKLGCAILLPRHPASPGKPVNARTVRLGTTTISAEAFEVSLTGRVFALDPTISDRSSKRARDDRERHSVGWFAIIPAHDNDNEWDWEPDDRPDLTEIIF